MECSSSNWAGDNNYSLDQDHDDDARCDPWIFHSRLWLFLLLLLHDLLWFDLIVVVVLSVGLSCLILGLTSWWTRLLMEDEEGSRGMMWFNRVSEGDCANYGVWFQEHSEYLQSHWISGRLTFMLWICAQYKGNYVGQTIALCWFWLWLWMGLELFT